MKFLIIVPLLVGCTTISEYQQGCLDGLSVTGAKSDFKQSVCRRLENQRLERAAEIQRERSRVMDRK